MDKLAPESPQTVTKVVVNICEVLWSINESMIGVGDQTEVWEWLKVNNKCIRGEKMVKKYH